MLTLIELENFLNELLKPQLFKDYCPNGLQVEGKPEINTIVTGVSANQELIDQATKVSADAIIVHHGFFWKNEDPCVTGIKRNRLAALLQNDISLLAYHLPLDAHLELGNNVQLGQVLGFHSISTFEPMPGLSLGTIGHLVSPVSGEELTLRIEEKLARKPLYIPGSAKLIEKVAWCTGAAQDFIDSAVKLSADAYITGEVSERTVHIAKEAGIHFFAAGHHATERYGIKALGDFLKEKFAIKHIHIDIENPV